MKLKALLTDDDAVSPVIGVILMVAITVILAAVIGTFVLGLGNQVGNNAPQASFTFNFDDGKSPDQLDIAHNGGASIPASQLTIKSNDKIAVKGNAGSSSTSTVKFTDFSLSDSDITAGDSYTIVNDNSGGSDSNAELNNDVVRVIWTSDSGDSSAELGKWTGPDA